MRRGKLTAAAVVAAAVSLLPAATTFGAGGDLDPSFDGDGKTIVNLASANAVGVAADGKLVLVYGESDSFAAVRLNANGSLDTSFDGDGKAVVDVTGGYDEAIAVGFTADGKIVIAGNASASYGVVRLNADGSLDTTFDADGRAVVDLGGFDLVGGVAVDASGRVVVGGYSDFGGGFSDFGIVRLTAAGALDVTFDGDGIARTDVAGSRDDVFDLVLQPDGKIVAAGPVIVGGNFDFGFVRYLADGSLDTSFSGDGKATVDFGAGDTLWGVDVDSAGRIVGGGYSGACCTNDFVAARLLADGTLDVSFSGDGKTDPVNLGGNDLGFDALVDGDDRVVVVGSREMSSDFDYGIVRFAADGTRDASFGTNGVVASPFTGGFARAFGVALQADGKLVVAGAAAEGPDDGAGVARLLSDDANTTPAASFTVTPASGTTATSFSFDGSGSSDPDGDALTYAWAFGDGATATGATATHAYAVPGTYTATLTVDDGRGGTNATTRSVTVTSPPPANRSPAASFTVSPASGTTATSFSFDGSASSDPDGDVLTYAWAFGDGGTGSGVTATHTYAVPGTYTATLTVGDGRGGTNATTRSVTVTSPPPANRSPAASFTVTPPSGTTATSFSFDGSASSDPDGDALTYAWAFGDGGTGSGVTATHTYAVPGTYTATLTVGDGRGGTGTATATVTVAAPAGGGGGGTPPPANRAPVAAFAYEPSSVAAGQPVRFDAGAASDPDGDGLTYEWGFGDGATGSGREASHVYARPGGYVVALTVRDGRGGSATTRRDIAVAAQNRFQLAVRKLGRGVGFVRASTGGLTCGKTCAAVYSGGARVALRAVPSATSVFRGWGGACSGSGATCELTVEAARLVTARFEPRRATDPYTLVATFRGRGVVATWEWGADGRPLDCGMVCASRFRRDSLVRLVAIPEDGYDFAGWAGACAGQGAWCSLRMSRTQTTQARFTPSPVALTVTRSAGGAVASWEWGIEGRPVDCGTVCVQRFLEGARVRVVAVPAPNYDFAGWTGACAGQGSWCELTMSSARSTHANFVTRQGSSG